MTDERYTFEQARLRLEEIAVQARKKDTTLEKSLDLLEEGARLALMCTELVDHTDFGDTIAVPADVVPDVDDETAIESEGAASSRDIADVLDGAPTEPSEPETPEGDGLSDQ